MSIQVEVISARDAADVEAAAEKAADVLAAGGLVVHPTETVYGIGGDGSAENNALIARVKLKEPDQPLLLLIPDLESLKAEFPLLEWPDEAEAVARHLWPGPLTIVVRCPGAPAGLEGPGEGLAIRVSPDPTVSAILRRWHRPMTSSSANMSGRPPARTIEQAVEVFEGRDDLSDVGRPILAIDAGTTKGITPSTMVSLLESPPRLIRQGLVGVEQLEPWLPGIK